MALEGLDYPFRFGPRGGLNRVTDEDKIKANLRAIINTVLGERVMEPQLGTNAMTRVFRNTTGPAEALVRRLVTDTIARDEPRIRVDRVTLAREDGRSGTASRVVVAYTLIESRSSDTLEVSLT